MIKYFSIAIILVSIISCATPQQIQKPVVVNPAEKVEIDENESIATVLSKLNKIDYKTFSGKAEVDYAQNNKSNSFDAKINMFKDSLIWLSVIGPLGIEVGRGIITKDSVKIINKFNREYIPRSISYLKDQLGLPFNFSDLQDLIVGNTVLIEKDGSSYTRQGNELAISSKGASFKNLLTVFLPNYLPSVSQLEDVDTDRKITATLKYDNYKTLDNRYFSTLRNILVNYKTKIDIRLNFKSFGFNSEISTPFSVPESYSMK